MKVIEASLTGVKILEPRVFGDDRGFFFESWNSKTFAALGIDASFVQDNHSHSSRNVLRGLHYQLQQPQGKLVRVVAGAVYDVAVDLRRSSPNFGRWTGIDLSAANKRLCWIPPGFAHGFLSLTDGTELLYKCTDFYTPQDERSVLWSDPTVGIAWPLDGAAAPILSEKDASAKPLSDCETYP